MLDIKVKEALKKIVTRKDNKEFDRFLNKLEERGLRAVPIIINGECVKLIGVE